MNEWFLAGGVILLPAVCTALGAAGVFLLRHQPGRAARQMLPGFAAGVMLAASVWSLLLPAIERAEKGRLPAWLTASGGLCAGTLLLLAVERAAGEAMHAQNGHRRMLLAITLHNLPEGMVVGLAAALALREGAGEVSRALAVSLGIGLQNIPEGAAVSLPMRRQGKSCARSFAAGTASGLVEPVGALAALLLAETAAAALPWLMSAAAGCMLCVVFQELLPQAAEEGSSWGVCSAVAGFALMMAMDVAL